MRPDVGGEQRRDKDRDEGQQSELAHGQAGRRDPRRREFHGKPPSWERPARSLPPLGGGREDAIDIVGIGPHRDVIEDQREVALEALLERHASCPPAIGSRWGSSVTSDIATRIVPRARCSRDLTVPTGGVERSQDVVDQIPPRNTDRGVSDSGVMERRKLDLDRTPTSTPSKVETGIDGESMEPAIERLGVS